MRWKGPSPMESRISSSISMVGLPSEREEELEASREMAKRVRHLMLVAAKDSRRLGKVTVSPQRVRAQALDRLFSGSGSMRWQSSNKRSRG